MARKPVLTGGKRDEILETAMKLFFENGYEVTSVRMIMNAVGGEIGMFYHYFKSKDELFDRVVERFFEGLPNFQLEDRVFEEAAERFLPLYRESMAQYGMLEGNMHWSVRYAMHARTVAALVPAVASFLREKGPGSDTPADVLAGQMVYGISGAIHSPSFEALAPEEKKRCLAAYIKKII